MSQRYLLTCEVGICGATKKGSRSFPFSNRLILYQRVTTKVCAEEKSTCFAEML